jgi:hypothetical protein
MFWIERSHREIYRTRQYFAEEPDSERMLTTLLGVARRKPVAAPVSVVPVCPYPLERGGSLHV